MAALANMADRESGDDYVLATGHAASVREFASAAIAAIDMPIEWQGHAAAEIGREVKSGKVRVRIDTRLLRPVDAPLLVGNAGKARKQLGFDPQIDLHELTRRMVEADLQRERNGRPG